MFILLYFVVIYLVGGFCQGVDVWSRSLCFGGMF